MKTVDSLSLSPCSGDDIADIAAMKAMDSAEYLHCPIDEPYALEEVLNMLESGHDIWIVRKNDISAGYGIGHRDNSDEYYADMVYVHPDMREQGIGKIIQETMMKYATLRGYTTFVSSVTANNIASIRMQQSLAMEFLPMKKGKGFNLRKKLNG